MQNRVSTYPGRVRLVPVSGQENIYDMTRADEPTEDGTPINKETLLTDQTAAMYPGLDESSTPNDAFFFLGNYTQWRWNRRTVVFEEVKGDEETISFGPAAKDFTVDYASGITIDQENGNISLQSPTSYSFTVTSSSSNLDAIENKFNSIKGKYIKSSGDVYFLGANFTCTSLVSGGSSVYVYLENVKKISVLKNTGHWEEVRASTDDAYPDSGISGGYEYIALGMPLENAKNSLIVSGTYVGTGSTQEIHLPFKAKFLVIILATTTSTSSEPVLSFSAPDVGRYQAYSSSAGLSDIILQDDGFELDSRMNESGYQYSYIAWG